MGFRSIKINHQWSAPTNTTITLRPPNVQSRIHGPFCNSTYIILVFWLMLQESLLKYVITTEDLWHPQCGWHSLRSIQRIPDLLKCSQGNQ